MKRLLILTISLLPFSFSYAQQLQRLVDSLARQLTAAAPQQATSVYLRSNKDVYVAGEDLWFNAFVLDASTIIPSTLDHILYVQLVSTKNDSIVWKEMYPIQNGVAAGHVFIPPSLPAGFFLLKAYSAHSFFARQPMFTAATPIEVVNDPRNIQRIGRLGAAAAYNGGVVLRLSVTPGGGQLIAGIPNTVAFKAAGSNSTPYNVQGHLLRNDSVIQTIGSLHAGIGHFVLTPQAGARYHIRIAGNPESLFPLPEVVTSGVQLQLSNNGDSLLCAIHSVNRPAQTVLISLQVRGELQAIASGKLSDSLRVGFPIMGLPAGAAIVTLYNEQLQVLSSQPVFIQPQRLQISFTQVKDQYAPKEQVSIKIKTTDVNGQPVPAMLSLRVHDQLFTNPYNAQDMQSYYGLTTQLFQPLHDPAWYFDSVTTDRIDGVNALLQLEHPVNYPSGNLKAVLPDSLPGTVLPASKNAKPQGLVSLLVFNYNKTQSQLIASDPAGKFVLVPEQLATGRRFFVKYLAEKEHKLEVADPFTLISQTERMQRPQYAWALRTVELPGKESTDTGTFQYGQLLQEVVVKAKGRGYGDRYLGYLDSIAKFEGNTDFVGQCGWLNCPACGSGTKPKEGVQYSELTDQKRNQVTSHPFSFGQGDVRKVTYKYPSYTEEELLRKFKMIMTRGFYQDRVYQSPDYSKDERSTVDMRNSLYWSPLILTDEKGEATIRFYTSDIRSGFIGIVEGISDQGAIGVGRFNFSVR